MLNYNNVYIQNITIYSEKFRLVTIFNFLAPHVTQSPSTPDLLYHHRQHYQGNYQSQPSPVASSTASTLTANHQLPDQQVSSKTLPFPHAHFTQGNNQNQNTEDNSFSTRFQHSHGKNSVAILP